MQCCLQVETPPFQCISQWMEKVESYLFKKKYFVLVIIWMHAIHISAPSRFIAQAICLFANKS